MNFDITVDPEAEEIMIIFDNTTLLKVSKLENDTYKYSNFHKIEDEGEELSEEIKKFAKALLNII